MYLFVSYFFLVKLEIKIVISHKYHDVVGTTPHTTAMCLHYVFLFIIFLAF